MAFADVLLQDPPGAFPVELSRIPFLRLLRSPRPFCPERGKLPGGRSFPLPTGSIFSFATPGTALGKDYAVAIVTLFCGTLYRLPGERCSRTYSSSTCLIVFAISLFVRGFMRNARMPAALAVSPSTR